MTSIKSIAVASAVAGMLSACSADNGAIGGADYAPQYEYSEFYAVADKKPFQVIVAGNPFPALPIDDVRRRLLPVMQANRPGPRLTFTYDTPAELPRPYYRLVLVFDAANDLTAARVCTNEIRRRPEPSGRFEVFAVYCRNELALSQAVARLAASSPEDPNVGTLLRQLFQVLFVRVNPARERPHPFFFSPGR